MLRGVVTRLVCVAAAVMLAGSGAGGAAGGNPRAYVLTLNDLPTGFAVTADRVVGNAAAAKGSLVGSLADFTRWGRVTGYERQFLRGAGTRLGKGDRLEPGERVSGGCRGSRRVRGWTRGV